MPAKVETLTQEQRAILEDELEDLLTEVDIAFDQAKNESWYGTKDALSHLKFDIEYRLKELRGQIKPLSYEEAIELAKTEGKRYSF
jgi:hypothetical protein